VTKVLAEEKPVTEREELAFLQENGGATEISDRDTMGPSGAPLRASKLGIRRRLHRCLPPEHRQALLLHLAVVGAMSLGCYSHQILPVGEQKSTWLQNISLPPPLQVLGSWETQPRPYLAVAIASGLACTCR
jgi:hypothetical protein